MAVTYGLLLWNIVIFAMYGLDKWKAIHNKYRISERTLLFTTLALGGLGSLSGMLIFRHKIRKKRFWIVSISSLFLLFYI